ncbi:MAG: dihydropteroate synthase [Flavisolibacter sp.]
MFTLNCRGRLLLVDKPLVMGIINITPDSFFSGSRTRDRDDILFRAEKMITEGASILDIGGQSTRPGSEPLEASVESQRVLPAIEAVAKHFPEVIISVDTFYASVLKNAVDAGARIANDVSAGTLDEALIPLVAQLKIPYVLMHMKGHPQTMQKNAIYENVVTEVFDWLNFKIRDLVQAGIDDIIIDPGFGFGKTIQHNFEILRQLSYFQYLQKPLMVGLSRKATVYKTLQTTPENALNGTTVLQTLALLKGAHILRVHDVREAVETITLLQQMEA